MFIFIAICFHWQCISFPLLFRRIFLIFELNQSRATSSIRKWFAPFWIILLFGAHLFYSMLTAIFLPLSDRWYLNWNIILKFDFCSRPNRAANPSCWILKEWWIIQRSISSSKWYNDFNEPPFTITTRKKEIMKEKTLFSLLFILIHGHSFAHQLVLIPV